MKAMKLALEMILVRETTDTIIERHLGTGFWRKLYLAYEKEKIKNSILKTVGSVSVFILAIYFFYLFPHVIFLGLALLACFVCLSIYGVELVTSIIKMTVVEKEFKKKLFRHRELCFGLFNKLGDSFLIVKKDKGMLISLAFDDMDKFIGEIKKHLTNLAYEIRRLEIQNARSSAKYGNELLGKIVDILVELKILENGDYTPYFSAAQKRIDEEVAEEKKKANENRKLIK